MKKICISERMILMSENFNEYNNNISEEGTTPPPADTTQHHYDNYYADTIIPSSEPTIDPAAQPGSYAYVSENAPKPKKKHSFLKAVAFVLCLAIVGVGSVQGYKIYRDNKDGSELSEPDSEEKTTSANKEIDYSADSSTDPDAPSLISLASRTDAKPIPDIVDSIMPSVVGVSSNFEYEIRVSCDSWIHIIDNKFVNRCTYDDSEVPNSCYSIFWKKFSNINCVNIIVDNETDCIISISKFESNYNWIVNGEKINSKNTLYMSPNEEYNISLVDNLNNSYEFYNNGLITKKFNDIYKINTDIDFNKYDKAFIATLHAEHTFNFYLNVMYLPYGVPHLNFKVKDGMLTVDKYGDYNITVVGALFDSNGKLYSNIKLNEGSIPLNIDSNSSFVFKIEYIKINDFKFENYSNQNINNGQFHFDDVIISNNN